MLFDFPWLALFDLKIVLAKFKKPLNLEEIEAKSDDFAILLPVFNDISYLGNIDFLAPYGRKVIICTSTNENAKFFNQLKEISRRYGFRISFLELGNHHCNPWALYIRAVTQKHLDFPRYSTLHKEKYLIFLDGDTYTSSDLRQLCGVMEEKNFDIASVKVLPSRRQTFIEHLQGVEYDIAMQARLIHPWLTSGACIVSRHDVICEIMKHHSKFFNGGDIEIGKLAQLLGYQVGHIPMVFLTKVPDTIFSWIRQRTAWMTGCFRHSIVNIDMNLRHPFHFIYYSVIVYLLLPFKIGELMFHWQSVFFIVIIYTVITFFINWKFRNRWMLLSPLYNLFQVTIILWLGIFRYIWTAFSHSNIGRIKFRQSLPDHVVLPKSDFFPSFARHAAIFLMIIFILLGTGQISNPYWEKVDQSFSNLADRIISGLTETKTITCYTASAQSPAPLAAENRKEKQSFDGFSWFDRITHRKGWTEVLEKTQEITKTKTIILNIKPETKTN